MKKDNKPSRTERLRYAFDNFMSRGPRGLIVAIFAAAIVVVLVVVGLLYGFGLVDTSDPDVILALWQAFLGTIEPGQIGNDSGSPAFLGGMLLVSFFGLFLVAILIGIIANGIQQKVEELRKGRSRLVEDGHVVILGWNQQIFTILSELIEANSNRRGATIAVLADMDKVEMEDAIRTRIPHTRGTRIVCRSGDAIDLAELEVINVQTSRAIIVLAPPSEDPDADVLKVLMAIINDPHRREAPYHVVAEMREPRNLEVAYMVGKDEVQMVLIGDIIARITAQTCRQPGLSVVYTELLDFEGDEIYTLPVPALTGKTFGDALLCFETSSLIGIMQKGGTPKLNPPMDTVIGADDKLVVISKDDDTIQVVAAGTPDLDALADNPTHVRKPERTLLLGWNWRAPLIVRELDNYVTKGSEVVVIADDDSPRAELERLGSAAQNQTVTFQLGDTTDRRLLDSLDIRGFQHVIIVSYSDKLDVQRSDGRTLITLLHLRDIAEKTGHVFSIVSEMLDLRNRALAEVTRADDFIVSDRLVSLYLSQVAENRDLADVFADLFDAEGSEVYVRAATEYVDLDRPISFYTVVEAARQRNEVAIGYRLRSQSSDSSHAYGVVVNPPKASVHSFTAGDRIIVLAED